MKKEYFFLLLFILPFLVFSQGSGSSLILNGSNQYVSIPNSTELNPITEITLESWFKHTQAYTGVGTESIVLKSFTSHSSPYYQYGLTTDGSNFGDKHFKFFLTTSDNTVHSVTTPDNFYTVGIWYHISGIYDGSIMKLFINGELVDSTPVTGTIASYSTGIELGTLLNYPASKTPGEFDEVRIWNAALTQTEIRDWMTKKVDNSHPNYANLVAYYNFDTGSGTTLVDRTSNGNDGTLVNSPTWQTSSTPIGDDTAYLTSVSNGSSLNLAHSDGSDLTVNVTSGTADAIYIYNVTEQPNITTPPVGLNQLSQGNYFGVKAFGSSSLIYEVVYNYDGHGGISDENNLRLCSRADNSNSSWIEESATINTISNTLTLGGQTGTEFILGSIGGNTLPVDDFSVLKYSMYPNPVQHRLRFKELDLNKSFYKVSDISGKEVLKGKFEVSNEINVETLKSGVYFLNINDELAGKFIKE